MGFKVIYQIFINQPPKSTLSPTLYLIIEIMTDSQVSPALFVCPSARETDWEEMVPLDITQRACIQIQSWTSCVENCAIKPNYHGLIFDSCKISQQVFPLPTYQLSN